MSAPASGQGQHSPCTSTGSSSSSSAERAAAVAAAVASLRQARSVRSKTQRELSHLQSAVTALLSLHNSAAAQPQLTVALSLGQHRAPVTVQVKQTPDRGVGGLLWQSSVVLAESLSVLLSDLLLKVQDTPTHTESNNRGKLDAPDHEKPVVIELGAGVTALPSLAAAALLGPTATVLATDTPEIVAIMQGSVRVVDNRHGQEKNQGQEQGEPSCVPMPGVSAIESVAPNDLHHGVTVAPCTWGRSASSARFNTTSCAASTASTDGDHGNSPPHPPVTKRLPQADVLLGADILYVERCHQDLIWTISDLLKTDGILLLAYAERSPESEQRFFTALQELTGIVCTQALDPCVRDGQTVYTVRGTRTCRHAKSGDAATFVELDDTTTETEEIAGMRNLFVEEEDSPSAICDFEGGPIVDNSCKEKKEEKKVKEGSQSSIGIYI